jgi:hypothetical protein
MYPNNYIPTSDGLAALRPPLCPQRGGKDYFIVLQNKRPVSVHAHTTRLSDLEVCTQSTFGRPLCHYNGLQTSETFLQHADKALGRRSRRKRPPQCDCVCSLLNAKMDSQVHNSERRALHQTQCAQQSTSFRPARAKDTWKLRSSDVC